MSLHHTKPLLTDEIRMALIYRFDNSINFFIILAVDTLAYSWQTVWAVGTSAAVP